MSPIQLFAVLAVGTVEVALHQIDAAVLQRGLEATAKQVYSYTDYFTTD